jgi:hypothetical protein
LNSINPSGSRVEISQRDSIKDVLTFSNDSKLEVLQFKESLPLPFFRALNQEFFSLRPDVELRAYGFYAEKRCDLSFLKEMINVERFRADCLQNAVGLENVSALKRLVVLGVGIFHLENFDFLDDVSSSLEDLTISQTKSTKPSLVKIGRFAHLRKLSLGGHSKYVVGFTTLRCWRTSKSYELAETRI